MASLIAEKDAAGGQKGSVGRSKNTNKKSASPFGCRFGDALNFANVNRVCQTSASNASGRQLLCSVHFAKSASADSIFGWAAALASGTCDRETSSACFLFVTQTKPKKSWLPPLEAGIVNYWPVALPGGGIAPGVLLEAGVLAGALGGGGSTAGELRGAGVAAVVGVWLLSSWPHPAVLRMPNPKTAVSATA